MIMKKNRDIYRVQKGDNFSLYTKNGLNHNINGPALNINKEEYFYINGESLTCKGWDKRISEYIAKGADPLVEKSNYDNAMKSSDGIYVHILESCKA